MLEKIIHPHAITITLTMLLLVFQNCAELNEVDPLLQEAQNYHLEAIKLNSNVEELLQTNDLPDSVLVVVKNRLETWEANLIEVPGFEDHHDHEHDHNHDHHDQSHHQTVEVTPEHMRNIQKECLDSIKAIQKDIHLLLNQ